MISKYFKQSEITCKCGCGFDDISQELISLMDGAREELNRPIYVTSGCRCKKHNESKLVRGTKDSSHIKGLAMDVVALEHEIEEMVAVFKKYFHRIGIDKKRHFIHVDVDKDKPNAIWNYK